MFFANTSTASRLTPLSVLQRLLQPLWLLLLPPPLRRPPPPPLLLPALLHQVPRQRSVHQLHQLRSLAASWLAAPQMRQLDLHLQQRLQQLAQNPQQSPSPRSSKSRTKPARSTGKRRR